MILKKKYKSNTSGISNICYDSTKKAWVFKKSINKVKHRKRFYETNQYKEFCSFYCDKKKIAWCLVEKFNTIPLNKNHIFFFPQNPDLYQYFTITIDEILFFCEQLQLSDDNKALIKYQKIKKEINESLDPNKYVKDLAVKYSKYNFKPELYLEKPELLVPISKLETYFCQLANLIKDKKDIKISKPVYNNIIRQHNNKLPKFINIKYKKALKSTVLGNEELNISIKNPELYEIIESKILDILYYCTKLNIKEMNHVVIQYKKMIRDIRIQKTKIVL
ncbi:hypothetical protein F8M41_018961 [Gigaspora margarita]|uniref:Uncharacterized protein n=1 Tax=Gigaspora margarita TaxID=4874 RepID=A0A8H4EKW4_GIGMA|nr:hypothetical protein F8M41_018961 [Gigaspora margarita]